MTPLLQQLFTEANKLSVAEQDRLAERIFAELACEDTFDSALENSTDLLAAMAQQALDEHRARLTEPLDPETILIHP